MFTSLELRMNHENNVNHKTNTLIGCSYQTQCWWWLQDKKKKLQRFFPKLSKVLKNWYFLFPYYWEVLFSNSILNLKKKVVWMSVVNPIVCFQWEGAKELRFGSKISYGLSQMPLQVIFMGGSFEYSNMIGWRFEGRGLNFVPSLIHRSEIIHIFLTERAELTHCGAQDSASLI